MTPSKEKGFRYIKLTQGYRTLVDVDDYERLNKHKWYCQIHRTNGVITHLTAQRSVKTNGKGSIVLMHREIIDAGNLFVDHINGNFLDNRKCNLRAVTTSQNAMNKQRSRMKTSSRYKGVKKESRWKLKNKWSANIGVGGKKIYLGLFRTEKDAALAYNQAALTHFGSFSRLNLIK